MCENKKEAHAERDSVVHYGIYFFFLDAMSPSILWLLVRECAESDGSAERTNVFFFPFLAFKTDI